MVYAEQVRDKFKTCHEHTTVRLFGKDPKILCLHKNRQRMLTFYLYVRHKLDVRNKLVMHTLMYVNTSVCGRMRNSTSKSVYAE